MKRNPGWPESKISFSICRRHFLFPFLNNLQHPLNKPWGWSDSQVVCLVNSLNTGQRLYWFKCMFNFNKNPVTIFASLWGHILNIKSSQSCLQCLVNFLKVRLKGWCLLISLLRNLYPVLQYLCSDQFVYFALANISFFVHLNSKQT